MAKGLPSTAGWWRNAMRRRSGDGPQVCTVTEIASTRLPEELIHVGYAKAFHVAPSGLLSSAASPLATASSPSKASVVVLTRCPRGCCHVICGSAGRPSATAPIIAPAVTPSTRAAFHQAIGRSYSSSCATLRR